MESNEKYSVILNPRVVYEGWKYNPNILISWFKIIVIFNALPMHSYNVRQAVTFYFKSDKSS